MLKDRQVLLAIETSTPVCSVALRTADGTIHQKTETGTGIHSEKTFLFIEGLLRECEVSPNQVDAVLVNRGPGSYTGLRIAASAAKGFLFGSDARLYSVNSLASIAMGAALKIPSDSEIHAVINARRTHLYHQTFRYETSSGKLHQLSDFRTLHLDEILESLKPGHILAGNGIQRIECRLPDGVKVFKDGDVISASAMIRLCQSDTEGAFHQLEDTALFEPVYQPG